MFHIVFDSKGAELLNAAMDMDEALDGEVILIQDDYSVGPIQNLLTEEGLAERKKWWDEVNQESTGHLSSASDTDTMKNILQRMAEEEFDQIWIWLAPNTRDLSG